MDRRTALRALMTLTVLSLILFAAGPATALQKTVGKVKPKARQRTRTAMKDSATNESPFACNPAGLNKEQRQRWMALIEKLTSTRQEVRELLDGYAFRFAAEPSTIQELAEFITYERQCCPFFDLEIALEREGGPAWLRFRGREGVKEFIRIEFGL